MAETSTSNLRHFFLTDVLSSPLAYHRRPEHSATSADTSGHGAHHLLPVVRRSAVSEFRRDDFRQQSDNPDPSVRAFGQ